MNNIKFLVYIIFLFITLATAKYTCQCDFSNNETRLISIKDKNLCKDECNKIVKEEFYSTECDVSTCTCKCGGKKLAACKKKDNSDSTNLFTGVVTSSTGKPWSNSDTDGGSSSGDSSDSNNIFTGVVTSSTGKPWSNSDTDGGSSSGVDRGNSANSVASASSGYDHTSGSTGNGNDGVSTGGGSIFSVNINNKQICAGSYCECKKELLTFKIL